MARTPSPEEKKATALTEVINAAKTAGRITGAAVGRSGESFQLTLGDLMRITATRKAKSFDTWTVVVEKRPKANAMWVADGAPLRGKPARQVFTALQDMHRTRQTAELRNAAGHEGQGLG